MHMVRVGLKPVFPLIFRTTMTLPKEIRLWLGNSLDLTF